MFIRALETSFHNVKKVKNYKKAIKEQFINYDKVLANTLMNKLLVMKHNKLSNGREHIIKMKDIVTQLKSLEIEILESFLIHLILNSLLTEYEVFKISYNTRKEKLSINELLTMCLQEEERLKHENQESAN